MRRCCLIANPASGGGRGARVLPGVRDALGALGVDDVHVTTHVGDERGLAREAALDGVETIIALGGDGTWGNTATGIVDSGRDVRLALMASGTGNDFAFAAGIPAADLPRAAAIAVGNGERRVDVGRVADTCFLNVCGFGFDADVLAVSQARTWIQGHPRYLVTAAERLFRYRGTRAAHTLDGSPPGDAEPLLMLTVSNGPRFGGGFMIAPEARVDDGLFDVVVIRDASPVRRMGLFLGALSGSHVKNPGVRIERSDRVRLRFDAPPWFDADGELHRATSSDLTVECLPGRLRIAVPTA